MEIKGIMLSNGQELIARVVSFSSSKLNVQDPLRLIVKAGEDGFAVNFLPWSIIAEGEIALNQTAVAAVYSVAKDVEDNYLQNVTGLAVVSAPAPQILHG